MSTCICFYRKCPSSCRFMRQIVHSHNSSEECDGVGENINSGVRIESAGRSHGHPPSGAGINMVVWNSIMSLKLSNIDHASNTSNNNKRRARRRISIHARQRTGMVSSLSVGIANWNTTLVCECLGETIADDATWCRKQNMFLPLYNQFRRIDTYMCK